MAARLASPLHWVVTLLLSGFLLSTSIAQALENQRVLWAGYACFGLMAAIVVAKLIRGGVVFAPEVALYWVFVAWSVATGLVVHIDSTLFFNGVERVVQVGILMSVVAAYTASARSPEAAFLAQLVLALVLVGYGFVSGDFSMATEMTERGNRVVGTRAASLTSNANSLGMICFWAITSLALAGAPARRRPLRIAAMILVVPLLAGLTLSASRKAFLIVFVFAVAWLWFCYRRFLLRNVRVFIGVAILMVVGYLFARFALEGTMLGHRLSTAAAATGERDASTASRLFFYVDGLQILASRPLTGVGLSQFQAHSEFGLYAHSQYMEILANTGPVGALLYFTTYVLAWRRLAYVYARAPDPQMRYLAGLCLAVLFSYVIVGFVLVQYTSFGSIALFGSLVGFSYGAARRIRTQAPPLTGGMPYPRPLAYTGRRRVPAC
ncbi:MAG: O-antigen ligase family protein [Verrucomicrobia bacterium]|nr:O-antigen ligase family protein [Verrucomicrobiota bacterium]